MMTMGRCYGATPMQFFCAGPHGSPLYPLTRNVLCQVCSVGNFSDNDAGEGVLQGTLTWGANQLNGSLSEEMLDGYLVKFIDIHGLDKSTAVARVAKNSSQGTFLSDCCNPTSYEFDLGPVAVPPDAVALMVVPFAGSEELLGGVAIPFVDLVTTTSTSTTVSETGTSRTTTGSTATNTSTSSTTSPTSVSSTNSISTSTNTSTLATSSSISTTTTFRSTTSSTSGTSNTSTTTRTLSSSSTASTSRRVTSSTTSSITASQSTTSTSRSTSSTSSNSTTLTLTTSTTTGITTSTTSTTTSSKTTFTPTSSSSMSTSTTSISSTTTSSLVWMMIEPRERMATLKGKFIMCTANTQDLISDPSFMVAVKTMLANITSLPVHQIKVDLFIGTSLCRPTRLSSSGSLRGLQSLTSAVEADYICSFPPPSSGEVSADVKALAAMKKLSSKSQIELTLLLSEIAERHTSFDLAKLPTISAGHPTLAVQQFVISTSSAPPDDSGLGTITIVQISATTAAVLISCCLVFFFWYRLGNRTLRHSMVRISEKDRRQDQWRNRKSLTMDTLSDKNIKQVSPEPEPEMEDAPEDVTNSGSLRSSAEVKDSEEDGAAMPTLNQRALSPPPSLQPILVPAAPEGTPPIMAVYDLPIKVRSSAGDIFVKTKVVMSGRPSTAPASRAARARTGVSIDNDNRPHSAVGAKRSVRRAA
eukprot:TRINITY_DN23288_c0_g1_i2.p1 TRINITY_DN23288_c0_g1~~TRINITY_DN23288_c0_g1_i2.p1  ORF type:complete len:700 (+),score=62.02 TRINITY_DN23288_c0_g1_i2:866-2965(+)